VDRTPLYLVEAPDGVDEELLADRTEEFLTSYSRVIRIRYPVDADGPIRTLLETIPPGCRATKTHPVLTPDDHWVLFIFGLDDLISRQNPHLDAALRDINGLRDLLLQLRAPTVFWAHKQALDLLAHDASDLWNWALVQTIPADAVPSVVVEQDEEEGVPAAFPADGVQTVVAEQDEKRAVSFTSTVLRFRSIPSPRSGPETDEDLSARLERLRPILLRWARSRGLSREDAEDVVQSALFAVWSRFVREPALRAWPEDRLIFLALHVCQMQVSDFSRRMSRHPQTVSWDDPHWGLERNQDQARVYWEPDEALALPEPIEPEPGPEQLVLASTLDPDLEHALLSLGVEDRELIVAWSLDEVSIRELATALGVTSNTAQKRLRLALERARKALGVTVNPRSG